MKKLLLMLLMCSAAFGQTEFTSIKLKNDPVTLNDTTKVDILVRENIGANKGMVRKITWAYLFSMLSGGNFIPLTGTGEGNPVTGDIVLDDGIAIRGTGEPGGIYFGIPDTGAIYVSGDPASNGVYIRHNNPTSLGFVGNSDFSVNNDGTDRKIYPQTGWVQDAIADLTLQEVVTAGGTFIGAHPVYIQTLGNDFTVSSSNVTLQAGGTLTLNSANIALPSTIISGSPTFSGTARVTTQSPNDNSTKVASTAYSDAKVADFINDGATTIAPSQNAVFDALAALHQEYPETTYSQTPVFGGGTSPSGTMVANWQATRTGKHVVARVNIYFPSAGASNTSVSVPFPTGLPTPAAVTGFNATDNHVVVCQGTMFNSLTGDISTLGRATLKKLATGYEIRIMQTSISATGVLVLLDYWTN